jgi:predicted membrane-bound dolichyl-phosphate-mannose-protein mannosyltransferase
VKVAVMDWKEFYTNFLKLATLTIWLFICGFALLSIIFINRVIFVWSDWEFRFIHLLFISASIFIFVLMPLIVKEFGFPRYVEEKTK